MAVHLTGLTSDDVAEVVECLLIGAATAAPPISDRRRDLAHRLGDALDLLPEPTREDTP
ncbi:MULTISPECIES: hypothetical protein [unclassified Streptomyces]|uniref:hypothetical protein n=1 Tax=unclassified Streptomyces TaxID=2593676 RepID=UPI003BB7C40A